MKRTRKPDWRRFEETARGVARGMSVREAATRAGYGARSKWIYKISKRGEFDARVEVLKREGPLMASDVEPVLVALMDGADAAMKDATGRGWSAAARMLAEAARIKEAMDVVDSRLEKDFEDLKREREELEWLRKWGPEE
jgi:hypothetical protein